MSKRWLMIVIAVLMCGEYALAQCGRWLFGPEQGAPGVEGTASCSTSWDPDGAGPMEAWLIVGGQFTLAGDIVVGNIAAWDGEKWLQLPGGLSSPVSALGVHDGQLLAGGNFTSGGISYLARWTGSGWQQFGPTLPGAVRMIEVIGGTLYVGAGSGGVFRWTGSSWESMGLTGEVRAMCAHGDDLIAGGSFTVSGGVTYNRVARWDGSTWHPMGLGADNMVSALCVYEGDLYAAGEFDRMDGVGGTSGVARWDGQAWNSVGNGIPGGSGTSLKVYGGKLWIGGVFNRIGELATLHTATWDGESWSTPFELGAWGFVSGLALHRGHLAIAGNFRWVDQWPARGVTLYDGQECRVLGNGLNDLIRDMVIWDGKLVVTGIFTSAGDKWSRGVAMWDGVEWHAMGEGLAAPGYTLLVHNGVLYAGTDHPDSGLQRAYVQRWTGSEWEILGTFADTGTLPIPSVRALGVDDEGNLVAGGLFVSEAGSPDTMFRVARLIDGVWRAMGTTTSSTFNDLLNYSGLLMGNTGSIRFWNGTEWVVSAGSPGGASLGLVNDEPWVVGSSRAYRWNGSTWVSMSSTFTGTAYGIGGYRGAAIIAGSFDTLAFGPRVVRRLVGTTWSNLGGEFTGSMGIYAHKVLEFNGELIVGGRFTTCEGKASSQWARWTDTGVPWIARQPRGAGFEVGETVQLSVTPASGYEFNGPLSYQWKRNGNVVVDGAGGASVGGGVVSGAGTRTLTIVGAGLSDKGTYRCTVSNSCGSVVSAAAMVGPECPGDLNGDGGVNSADLSVVLSSYGLSVAPGSAGDVNADGVVDGKDLMVILSLFGGVC